MKGVLVKLYYQINYRRTQAREHRDSFFEQNNREQYKYWEGKAAAYNVVFELIKEHLNDETTLRSSSEGPAVCDNPGERSGTSDDSVRV